MDITHPTPHTHTYTLSPPLPLPHKHPPTPTRTYRCAIRWLRFMYSRPSAACRTMAAARSSQTPRP